MALATTCPKCQTSFRVAPDQLALRRGMVRCGVCQNVFSGMANLRHVDEILRQRSSARAAAQQALHPAPRESAGASPKPAHASPSPGSGAGSGAVVEQAIRRDTKAETRSAPSAPPQEFQQTDLRTAFFLPETVFGPVTQIMAAPAQFATAPAVIPESIQPDKPAAPEGLPTATGPALTTDAAALAERPGEDSAAGDKQPAIALRRPGPDTRIRWAHESEQAKRESGADGPGVGADPTPTSAPTSAPTALQPMADALDSAAKETTAADRSLRATAPDAETPGAEPSDIQPALSVDASHGTTAADTAVIDDVPTDTRNADVAPATLNARGSEPAGGKKRRRKRPVDRSDEAIAYFEPDASHIGFSSRSVAVGWLICLFAAVLLLFQLLLGSRNVLAANVPLLRAPLQSVSGWLGLEIEPPRDLQAVTIESFELHAIDNSGQLALSALLRNRASHVVQWPALEVALTDGQGTLLVRKVLLPRDYFQGLPAGTSRQTELGMNPRAELPLKLTLQARELAASGYSVTLFYP